MIAGKGGPAIEIAIGIGNVTEIEIGTGIGIATENEAGIEAEARIENETETRSAIETVTTDQDGIGACRRDVNDVRVVAVDVEAEANWGQEGAGLRH